MTTVENENKPLLSLSDQDLQFPLCKTKYGKILQQSGFELARDYLWHSYCKAIEYLIMSQKDSRSLVTRECGQNPPASPLCEQSLSIDLFERRRCAFRQCQQAVAERPWPGRGGSYMRAVLQAHLLHALRQYSDLAMPLITSEQNNMQDIISKVSWLMSSRTGAIIARCSAQTFASHTRSLCKSGWLISVSPSNKMKQIAGAFQIGQELADLVFNNSDPMNIQLYTSLKNNDRDSQMPSGCTKSLQYYNNIGNKNMKYCKNNVHYTADTLDNESLRASGLSSSCLGQTETYGLFERSSVSRRAFGKAGEEIYIALKQGPLSIKALVTQTGRHRNTVSTKLKLMEGYGLVYGINGEWTLAHNADLERIASDLGLHKVALVRKAIFKEERSAMFYSVALWRERHVARQNPRNR